MRETECLQVFQPHIAEVWRLTFKTPPPTNPRTFVVLLLSRELKQDPPGQRCFMNSTYLRWTGCERRYWDTVSIPFEHPDCPPKQGKEAGTVRGKYVSVERVSEAANGAEVDWRMATSSDAGGKSPLVWATMESDNQVISHGSSLTPPYRVALPKMYLHSSLG
jgi:hypothetical protein